MWSRKDCITKEVTLLEAIEMMADGHGQAAQIIKKMISKGKNIFEIIDSLDDMNIRGGQLIVAYKYFAGEDLETLVSGILDRNPFMVEAVNKYALHYGWEAVCENGQQFRNELFVLC